MKKILALLTLILPLLATASDVGVSITIGHPDYYGAITLGDVRPTLISPQPVIISPGVVHEPLYLRVPPGQYKKWGKYCDRYNACGRPVYFVTDDWYRNSYVPGHSGEHPGRGHAWGHDKDHGWKEGRDEDDDHERGHGHGHGHNKDR